MKNWNGRFVFVLKNFNVKITPAIAIIAHRWICTRIESTQWINVNEIYEPIIEGSSLTGTNALVHPLKNPQIDPILSWCFSKFFFQIWTVEFLKFLTLYLLQPLVNNVRKNVMCHDELFIKLVYIVCAVFHKKMFKQINWFKIDMVSANVVGDWMVAWLVCWLDFQIFLLAVYW